MNIKAIILGCVGSLGLAGSAYALPFAPMGETAAAPVEQVQYYGGPRCFYPDGWHGPGYYRCGFRFRRGLGFLGGGGGGFRGDRGGFGRGGFRGGHGGARGGGHGGAHAAGHAGGGSHGHR